MLSWFSGIFGRGINSVRDLASSVYTALKHIWAVLTGLGHIVGVKWGDVVNGAHALRYGLQSLANAAYARFKHIITVQIPRVIAAARKEWNAAVNAARNAITTGIADAKQFATSIARQLVAALAAFVIPKVESVLSRMAELYNSFQHVKDRVTALLTHPEALVQWILNPLVGAITRYVQDHAEALAAYLLKHAITLVLRGANTLEDIITRVL